MSWFPISGTMPQYFDVNGDPFSGAVLKAYTAGTSTNIVMATDSTGVTMVTSIALNALGYPEVSSVPVIPHIQETYKLSLYPTQAAADSNTGALWTQDDMTVSGGGAGGEVISITSNTAMDDTYLSDTLSIINSPTITLPDVSTEGEGFVFYWKNAGTGFVTFDGFSAELVNGSATVIAAPNTGGRFMSSATGWVATGITDSQATVTSGSATNLVTQSAQATDTDVVAEHDFTGQNDASEDVIYGRVDSNILDNTDTEEDGYRSWWTMIAGTLTKVMNLGQGLWMEGATGGDQGLGTINATAFYKNGELATSLIGVQIFTGSGTYTPTAGMIKVLAIAVGGGAGGKADGGGTNEGAGGNTTLGALLTANGGAKSSSNSVVGGTGGAASGGDENTSGQKGGDGYPLSGGLGGASTMALGGLGGSNEFGQGGQGGKSISANSVGEVGAGHGAGGGGGARYSSNYGGGSGGGAGGVAKEVITSATIGASQVVTIGAGGAGGTANASGGAGSGGILWMYEYG